MQMLFIILLLKTGNPYYIIVNILTDNGENTMQNEKTSVLVLAQCDLTMRETLNNRFGTQCVHVRGGRRTPDRRAASRGCGYFRRTE